MPQEVRMPSLGQTTDELTIVAWLKAEGDVVSLGEPLLAVETDKATLDVEAIANGTLQQIVHAAGQTVEAGTIIAYIAAPNEATTVPAQAAPTAKQPSALATPAPSAPPAAAAPGKVLASPVARALARDNGIDIRTVRGSGPGGRIDKKDVVALLSPATLNGAHQPTHVTPPQPPSTPTVAPRPAPVAAAPVAATPPEGPLVDAPVARHRQIIAQRLTRSIQTIPQINMTTTVTMSRARAFLTAQRAAGLTGLTYTHLLLRALGSALATEPRLNQLWIADGPALRTLPRPDIGLAVAGDDTLLVVTIPDPAGTPLSELVDVTSAAVERGRVGKLTARDTAPAAITLSNLGMYGIDHFQPIVDPEQTAILGAGRVMEQVTVLSGGMYVVPQMQLTLAVDHRVADGVVAARFLQAVRESLEA